MPRQSVRDAFKSALLQATTRGSASPRDRALTESEPNLNGTPLDWQKADPASAPETAQVLAWIRNAKGHLEKWQKVAKKHSKKAPDNVAVDVGALSADEVLVAEVARQMEEEYTKGMPKSSDLYGDLLAHAVHNVNWIAVAAEIVAETGICLTDSPDWCPDAEGEEGEAAPAETTDAEAPATEVPVDGSAPEPGHTEPDGDEPEYDFMSMSDGDSADGERDRETDPDEDDEDDDDEQEPEAQDFGSEKEKD